MHEQRVHIHIIHVNSKTENLTKNWLYFWYRFLFYLNWFEKMHYYLVIILSFVLSFCHVHVVAVLHYLFFCFFFGFLVFCCFLGLGWDVVFYFFLFVFVFVLVSIASVFVIIFCFFYLQHLFYCDFCLFSSFCFFVFLFVEKRSDIIYIWKNAANERKVPVTHNIAIVI